MRAVQIEATLLDRQARELLSADINVVAKQLPIHLYVFHFDYRDRLVYQLLADAFVAHPDSWSLNR